MYGRRWEIHSAVLQVSFFREVCTGRIEEGRLTWGKVQRHLCGREGGQGNLLREEMLNVILKGRLRASQVAWEKGMKRENPESFEHHRKLSGIYGRHCYSSWVEQDEHPLLYVSGTPVLESLFYC